LRRFCIYGQEPNRGFRRDKRRYPGLRQEKRCVSSLKTRPIS
jgi:hypothetical protein